MNVELRLPDQLSRQQVDFLFDFACMIESAVADQYGDYLYEAYCAEQHESQTAPVDNVTDDDIPW